METNFETDMKILNLGCGTMTCDRPEVINIDWSIFLRIKKIKVLNRFIPLFFRGERFERLSSIPDNIMVYNLERGIPFASDSVDVVYHSHLLEHLEKNVAEKFLAEAKRVMKPGGIHRIVVPDLEKICKEYIMHILSCEEFPEESNKHDNYIAALIEQCVRKEAYGTSQQSPSRRFVENFVLGDARRRGETHQWMYDRINLSAKLFNIGYKEVHIQSYKTSLIPDWNQYRLEVDDKGNQRKPESLYVEAVK